MSNQKFKQRSICTYHDANYNIDYKNEFKKYLQKYNMEIEKNPLDKKQNENFLYKVFDLSINLNKEQYDDYIKLLKKNKIYKYKNSILEKVFTRLFLKTRILLYALKNDKNNFFKTKYASLFPKKIRMRLLIFLKYPTSKKLKKLHKTISKKLIIDYLELVVTTKCTLRCKNCANLMHMYEKPYDVEDNLVLKSIEKLNECVDEVLRLRILGGEPFCNPNLKKYLSKLQDNKYLEIIIVTNGTIVPKDKELMSIIKEKNISIEISNYGKLSYKKDELIKLLKQEKINFSCEDEQKVWYDYGEVKKYRRSDKELKQQFKKCNNRCKSILNGAIYYCPRASHGYDLGKIKKREYVDLVNNSKKQNIKSIKKLMFRNEYIEACKYCKFATKDCKIIKSAEQINKRKSK